MAMPLVLKRGNSFLGLMASRLEVTEELSLFVFITTLERKSVEEQKVKKGCLASATTKMLKLIGIASLVGTFAVIAILNSVPASQLSTYEAPKPVEKPKPLEKESEATIEYNDLRIKITNENSFTWESCYMTLNRKYIYPDYPRFGETTKKVYLEAGKTSTLVFSEFISKDNQRFNPFAEKPQTFVINCDGQTMMGWEL